VSIIAPLTPVGGGAFAADRTEDGSSGAPFYVRDLTASRDASVGQLGSSSQVLQASVDPRSSVQRTVASSCPAPAAGSPPDPVAQACRLLTTDLIGGGPLVARVSDRPEGANDRLPSAYAGAVAFARLPAGSPNGQLRYAPAGSTSSQPLRGGPRGMGARGPVSIALRGTSVAYLWRWRPRSSATRTTLQIQGLGQPLRTVRSIDLTDGRFVGIQWVGAKLVYAVRRGSSSRLYRYDPSTRRTSIASAARNLASFTVSGKRLFYVTAGDRTVSSGRCPETGCRVYETAVPTFRR
jgi:hypothetical protein